ncbi:DUF7159 family protein [Mycolicibacterium diernhoferi]|uniref:DUF7159 domain-containing protein n=1 Tax=Mycolicibacterium diernhoferi TaxID=1801 RepID=A0A1Q4H747_9MYCO|nr:hypothetical protein [Mycolicibacterium diernhoferi]OJZ63366.1 hypothetical protein BRW64_22410 [Mycolicibacterium diernhoferi]OPE54265.1 hypothetical protein BV510_11275 [Mycolicibacterium diernhoferi]PEG54053.1 hypothetical protein CRI78_13280 [Mycolicibacterium diernhoferi]QYL20508.1 hypothetical protein K0O62_15520 [Mycolicibacterium diernhoferi]
MDAVLGLSMTTRSLSVVVVGGDPDDGDGHRAGGPQDAFEMAVDGADVRAASEQAAAAVEAIAASHGRRLTSIGVTWSDDADAEASLLMESLTESGFGNVVPIRLPEATEALARGMADVIGYRTSAVCVLEPDTAIALIVHTDDGAVQTAINHTIDSDESLIGWLSTVFTRADWQPEALVLVGSAGGFDAVLPRLQEALSVPVFAPPEAPLALARGAALASTHSADLPLDTGSFTAGPRGGRHSAGGRRPSPSQAFTGLLAAGVLTFVVSASVAVAVQLSPRQTAPPEPVATAERVSVPAPPSRVPAPVPVPPAEAPVIAEPAEAVAPVVEPVVEAVPPPVEVVPVLDTAPVQLPYEAPVEAPAPAPPPQVLAPPPVAPPPVVSPVYEPPKKPLLQRIRDRLRLGGDEQGPPAVIRPPSMG